MYTTIPFIITLCLALTTPLTSPKKNNTNHQPTIEDIIFIPKALAHSQDLEVNKDLLLIISSFLYGAKGFEPIYKYPNKKVGKVVFFLKKNDQHHLEIFSWFSRETCICLATGELMYRWVSKIQKDKVAISKLMRLLSYCGKEFYIDNEPRIPYYYDKTKKDIKNIKNVIEHKDNKDFFSDGEYLGHAFSPAQVILLDDTQAKVPSAIRRRRWSTITQAHNELPC